MTVDPNTPAPTLDARANLNDYPWTQTTPDNTSGGYLVSVGLSRDEWGRGLVSVLVQVAPDHYVVASTTVSLARKAVRLLGASRIAGEK